LPKVEKVEKAEKTEKAQPAVAAVPLDLPVIDADSPVILAEIAPTSDSDAPADAGEVPATPVTASAGTTAPLPVATPSMVAPSASAPSDSLAPEAAQVDQIANRELDLAKDGRWLDQLARDISQTATRDGQLRFQLNPEHLGALTIEIANSAAGTAIRMTTESDQARAIIADAQPRLLAEVRAQGLRVSESHVDLNQQQSNGGSTSAQAQQQQQQNRQPSEDSKPFVRTQSGNRDDAVDSASDGDGELYA
jgi:flagellar hook-length control protein FliK